MYCLFIVFVVVFSQLTEKHTQQCQGRLPATNDTRPKVKGLNLSSKFYLYYW